MGRFRVIETPEGFFDIYDNDLGMVAPFITEAAAARHAAELNEDPSRVHEWGWV